MRKFARLEIRRERMGADLFDHWFSTYQVSENLRNSVDVFKGLKGVGSI